MGILDNALKYLPQLTSQLAPDEVIDTPEAAIDIAGKFAVPDNTQFYRDELNGLAAKRAEALKDNRWLALAQFGAGIADGRRSSLAPAAQSGLAALRSANVEDDAGRRAEMESRLKLAGMDQNRMASQMATAKDLYGNGLAAKLAAKRDAFKTSIDMAQSDRSNALGYAQLRDNDPDARYAAAMKIPGVTEKDARAFAFGTKAGNRGETWVATAMNYLKMYDNQAASGVRPSKEAKEMADMLRDKVNNYMVTGELPAEALVDNEGGTALPGASAAPNSTPVVRNNDIGPKGSSVIRPAAVAEQAASMSTGVAEMANKGDLLINKAGSYQNAKAEITNMKLPQRDKIELLTALEAAKNRRMAMAGARGQ